MSIIRRYFPNIVRCGDGHSDYVRSVSLTKQVYVEEKGGDEGCALCMLYCALRAVRCAICMCVLPTRSNI